MFFSALNRIRTDQGSGSPVLCLHGSLGSHRQWQQTAEQLSRNHRVLAADLLGYGDEEQWPEKQTLQLRDEYAPLVRTLENLSEPVHLAGHSYGGAVCLRLALDRPDLIRSLTIYEPVLFGLLITHDRSAPTTQEARGYAESTVYLAQQNMTRAAARCFIDYWNGRGVWDGYSASVQSRIARAMPKVAAEWGAVFTESPDLRALRSLPMPVNLLVGTETLKPAVRIVEILRRTMPHAQTFHMARAGHMGPFTAAARFNRALGKLLRQAEQAALAEAA